MTISWMWKPGTKYVANQSKKILINPEKRPSVITLIGKNKSFKIGRTRVYKIVMTTLAIISVIRLEKPTVGSAQASTPSEKAVIKIDRIICQSIDKLGRKVNEMLAKNHVGEI